MITGANDLAAAISALRAYARAPSAAGLARYQSELPHGREEWNQGISQLWYLAHKSNPPTRCDCQRQTRRCGTRGQP